MGFRTTITDFTRRTQNYTKQCVYSSIKVVIKMNMNLVHKELYVLMNTCCTRVHLFRKVFLYPYQKTSFKRIGMVHPISRT